MQNITPQVKSKKKEKIVSSVQHWLQFYPYKTTIDFFYIYANLQMKKLLQKTLIKDFLFKNIYNKVGQILMFCLFPQCPGNFG